MNQFQNSPEERFFKQNAWPSWIPRLLAAALGIILLAAGLSKATDMALFVRQIRDYGIISNFLLLNLGAWGLIVLESTLGTGLLVFYRPRLFLLLTALLLLIFSGTSTWALLSGSMEDCGCFGAWLKRTPGEALIETLILLATALVAWVGQRNRFISKARPKVYIVAVGCLVGLIMPLFFGSPILRLGQSPWETVELELRNLKPQGLEDLDLNKGVHLIIIMDTECAHCRDEIEELGLSGKVGFTPPDWSLTKRRDSDQKLC